LRWQCCAGERHRDAKFGADFYRVAKGAAIRLLKTAVQAPLMNATCERFLGSVRRECLDHVIILGERPPPLGSQRGCRVTYSEEAPNALAPEMLPVFLAALRELFPQHYAMTYLGFTTGLRPSSLRWCSQRKSQLALHR
jgi:hypothetical protein